MPSNFYSLILLIIAVFLLILNQYYLNNQIPSWVFIILLVLWLIIKVRTIRNMRRKK